MVQATSPAAVRSLLGRYDLAPRKRLGQHFLWQQQVVKRMADAAELDAGDLVLEIGPGLGILTAACAERAGRVIAVEVDRDLFPLLEAELGAYPNVRLVQGDARQADFVSLARTLAPDFASHCKVLGNLPYYLTSPLLVRLLSGALQAELMVLMVQQEVAGRIVADPGGKEYGSLSVLVQYYAMPELLFKVAPHDFWPQPQVTSAVVRLRLRPQPAVTTPDPALFFQVVRAAFRYRRKTLRNALGEAGLLPMGEAAPTRKCGYPAEAVFEEAGIDPVRRGETLDLAEFACLAEALARARERMATNALH
ncbi:MAG: 16S rRNA (adenine(1518)-N(6)/adenine(1519)-N(6))-dimethyltransferase RsmA [Thermacetogeniaceae bacterium]|jgi:16S rRNA (adenine1518-N6/adenine1519-N6)-dimethyltransferase